MLVLCGEEDRYNCAELASYYPSTFDDMPEPELQRKTKWMGKIVRDAIRDKKGLGFDVVKSKKIWDRYDEDKSGSMDLDELNRVIRAMRKTSGDKDLPYMTPEVGIVAWQLLCHSERAVCLFMRLNLLSSRAVVQQFAEVDADGSGELEFQEFADWYSALNNAGSSIENLFKSLDSDGAHHTTKVSGLGCAAYPVSCAPKQVAAIWITKNSALRWIVSVLG